MNDERCVVAPVSWRVPVKVISPGMAFPVGVPVPLLAGLALPGEGAAAAEEGDDGVPEPADRVAAADGAPDEQPSRVS